MESPSASFDSNALPGENQTYCFPSTPFENIGFALSGGGFRAASFGLGVLSLMHRVKLEEDGVSSRLIEKIKFISSASGGTITLSAYMASLYKQDSFETFYHRLKGQMAGETMVGKAIENLKKDSLWTEDGKSRNIINAFSLVYHDYLFDFLPEEKRTLGGIMPDVAGGGSPVHIQEFCFNATEFYTGIPFRFQAGEKWQRLKGASFGNSNITIDWENENLPAETLKGLRLSDVLAASSCFPLGFEPLVYPKDFAYKGGPSAASLKDALVLKK